MAKDGDLITLAGEIDMARSGELRSLVQAYAESPSVNAVVDMAAVDFCGSEGIDFLAGLVDCARSKIGTVTVVNASDAVQRLIKICGLDDTIRQAHH
jgi:anti-sigma B factor antagonist